MNWYVRSKIFLMSGEKKEYGWFSLPAPSKTKRKIAEFAKKIKKNDLYVGEEDWHGYGIEKNSHITVKYGILTGNTDEINKVLKGEKGGTVELDKIDLFENDDFDVLIIRVKSKDLNRINKKISDNIKNEDKYSKYQPHMTIAYLKKGKGEEYKELAIEYFELDDFSFDFDSILFEDKFNEETEIKLC